RSNVLPAYVASSLFLSHPPTTAIYTLSLHDALPISERFPDLIGRGILGGRGPRGQGDGEADEESADVTHKDLLPMSGAHVTTPRSEEHTSELQSRRDLVCRLLLEKKKKRR